jgi:hypothetical protein
VTKRTVYSVDARNHGDSPHTKVMSYSAMAKDIEQFVEQINAPKVSFLGEYSLYNKNLKPCLETFLLAL